jgi:hypothetical protein
MSDYLRVGAGHAREPVTQVQLFAGMGLGVLPAPTSEARDGPTTLVQLLAAGQRERLATFGSCVIWM